MSIDDQKYKDLYHYHRDQFNSENDRYNRLEDKATKYLGAITVTVSAYVLLVRWSSDSIFPPDGFWDWLAVISILLTFAAMASSWSFIFRSIKLQDNKKMPVGNEITEYFHDNERATIYLGLAKKYAEATDAKEAEYDKKLIYVRKGYLEIIFSGLCFIISVLLIFTNVWMEG